MKYSKEFADIICHNKSKKEIKRAVKIWLAYRRTDIRFYGGFKHIPEPTRANIVIRTLDTIRAVKSDLKEYIDNGGKQLIIF